MQPYERNHMCPPLVPRNVAKLFVLVPQVANREQPVNVRVRQCPVVATATFHPPKLPENHTNIAK